MDLRRPCVTSIMVEGFTPREELDIQDKLKLEKWLIEMGGSVDLCPLVTAKAGNSAIGTLSHAAISVKSL
ncbi:hypothetical protein FRX31_020123 [Thalictrum thalictroides]|uniref:Uncharacterized protein n=1 Tax=Thalictrum thalictroides TaxID=46969 RepID=A0A7J6VYT9_THATH|nr:hypothetical protein FRX31_020123 [Thalictrum thalictroides]